MCIRAIIVLLAFLASAARVLATSVPSAADLKSKLTTSVLDYHLSADNFLLALIHIGDEFRLPMGIEWINATPATERVDISFKKATVQDILNAVLKTHEGYEMHIDNGVVHVTSTRVSPAQNFLLVKIKSFEVHDEVLQVAQLQLREMIQQTVAPKKASAGGTGRSMLTNAGEPKINTRVNDDNVEGVLDALVAASAKKIWVATFVNSFLTTAGGFRRTESLWSTSTIPDSDQPAWNMFGWDESIPTAQFAHK